MYAVSFYEYNWGVKQVLGVIWLKTDVSELLRP